MESPVRERVVTDITQTAEKHFRIASDLLAAHAVSGRDTVAGYYGIGKSKVIKMLQAGYSLKSVGDVMADMNDMLIHLSLAST